MLKNLSCALMWSVCVYPPAILQGFSFGMRHLCIEQMCSSKSWSVIKDELVFCLVWSHVPVNTGNMVHMKLYALTDNQYPEQLSSHIIRSLVNDLVAL